MFSSVFNNAGMKLQIFAKIIFCLGVAGSVLGGLMLIFAFVDALEVWGVLIGVGVAVFGCVSTWLVSLLIHGVGTVCETFGD